MNTYATKLKYDEYSTAAAYFAIPHHNIGSAKNALKKLLNIFSNSVINNGK